jgi:hypothetical protein
LSREPFAWSLERLAFLVGGLVRQKAVQFAHLHH